VKQRKRKEMKGYESKWKEGRAKWRKEGSSLLPLIVDIVSKQNWREEGGGVRDSWNWQEPEAVVTGLSYFPVKLEVGAGERDVERIAFFLLLLFEWVFVELIGHKS
jgi:hypothetical protein